MYKIIAAVNSMIERSHLIEQVTQYEVGFYFTYNGKYVWSIGKSEDYYLVLYPQHKTISEVLSDPRRLDNCLAYNTSDMKAKEALESFAELYQVVQNKFYGIDSVLDDIINTVA